MIRSTRSDMPAYLAAASLAFAFGSIHSFSVFLEPLESEFKVQRATLSLAYSMAILSLTAGVLASGRMFANRDRRVLAVACCAISVTALLVAAIFPGITVFLITYGLVFGFCNGLAYALLLDGAAAAVPERAGLAIGSVTAIYGAGAAMFSLILAPVAQKSPSLAMTAMAGAIAVGGLISLLWFSRVEVAPPPIRQTTEERHWARFTVTIFWLLYAFAACGGLMIIGHATAIFAERDSALGLVHIAAPLNLVGNVAGCAIAGWLSDRHKPTSVLIFAVSIEAISLLALRTSGAGTTALIFLTLCGYSYGTLIAVIPLALRSLSLENYFGTVFTAWGLAGLIGPVLAAVIFDKTKAYNSAIDAAAFFSCLALVLAFCVPKIRPNA